MGSEPYMLYGFPSLSPLMDCYFYTSTNGEWAAVSYTHLRRDGRFLCIGLWSFHYQRGEFPVQQCHIAQLEPVGTVKHFILHFARGGIVVGTVSYTHLDVYKRQPITEMPANIPIRS